MSMWKKLLRKAEGGDEKEPLAQLEGLDDEQKEAVAQLLAAKDEQIAQLQQSKAEDDEDKADDEEEEGEAEEENKALEDDPEATVAEKAVAKARREVAELRKSLEAERNLRLDREYVEKARAYSSIPVPAEKMAGLMRSVAERASGHAATLEQVLKACDTLAREGGLITKSLGRASGGGASSVGDEIEEVAASLMKADPKLSKAEAIAKAWTPERIRKHRDETARA